MAVFYWSLFADNLRSYCFLPIFYCQFIIISACQFDILPLLSTRLGHGKKLYWNSSILCNFHPYFINLYYSIRRNLFNFWMENSKIHFLFIIFCNFKCWIFGRCNIFNLLYLWSFNLSQFKRFFVACNFCCFIVFI